MNISSDQLARMIDHTLLRPEATRDEVEKVCEEGRCFNFATVCVNPAWVSLASKLLKGTGVKVNAVIGFPFGATMIDVKVFETKRVLSNGAEEIDMVMNFGAFRSGDLELVKEELRSVVDITREHNVVSKIIIETCYLTQMEKIKACQLVMDCGANFVKTSTGFGTSGATVEDVKLLRQVVDHKIGIKASGGIRTYDDAVKMIHAGASRIGSSAGVNILRASPSNR